MSRQRLDAEARRDASVSTRIMGFMKRFTRKKSPKDKDLFRPRYDAFSAPQPYHGPDQFRRLDDKLLLRIFEHVCPHATDDSLDSSEESGNDGCMSCDTRDLAHCALVKRQWYGVSAGLLYRSIRIDAVHYCELEEVYAEQRRRKSRNGEDTDAPTLRLLQLCRTVRENHYVGSRVRFLKLPYMTRESCKAEIARTVSVCPNIEFVDLPDGFFNGDVTCHTLRQEMQARCTHMRKMKYNEGGEQSLESLMHGYWQELRVIELNRIQMEPTILRRVFGILPWLSDITFADLRWLDDSIFHPASGLPDFPALDTLKLRKIDRITAHGLAQYLSSPVCSNALRTLSIKDCAGLPVQELHLVLGAAMAIETLEYTATVSAALPLDPYPPLLSYSLRKMNFEIISNGSNQMYPPGASYYQYLTKSLMSSSLPALRKLYVRDPSFPESLVLAPPLRPFADSPAHTPRGINQPLEVFSKGSDELEWIFTSIIPADVHGRRGSMSGGRPLSSYSAHKGLGPQWGGDARKSIVVPNGFGGFLAIPADNERPRSAGHISPSFPSHGHSQSMGHIGNGNNVRASFMSHAGRDKRASRADLWR